ncbi:MAG TPA: hypothetical protein PLB87_08110, partial [Prolixibacteraceae bacterium]|nr:hypothetical protein [Prolixibacteraceae bacterium]
KLKAAGLSNIWICAGDQDANFSSVLSLHNRLLSEAVDHHWQIFEGSNNWLTWRKALLVSIKK